MRLSTNQEKTLHELFAKHKEAKFEIGLNKNKTFTCRIVVKDAQGELLYERTGKNSGIPILTTSGSSPEKAIQKMLDYLSIKDYFVWGPKVESYAFDGDL